MHLTTTTSGPGKTPTLNRSYGHGLYRTITVVDSASSDTEYLSVGQSSDRATDGSHRVPFTVCAGQVADIDMVVAQHFGRRPPPLLVLENSEYAKGHAPFYHAIITNKTTTLQRDSKENTTSLKVSVYQKKHDGTSNRQSTNT